jgi:hypothetical protein
VKSDSLLKKMTYGLQETYNTIKNKIEVPVDQIFKEDILIKGQYKIIKYLGRGVFGMVV